MKGRSAGYRFPGGWVLLLAGLVGVISLGAPPPLAAQQTGTGTGQVRPDSARALILDRIRAGRGAPGDTLAADSLREVGAERRDMPIGVSMGRTPTRAPELPAGADSVMRALITLPGYTPAVYQGNRADFNARNRNLHLVSSDSIRARFFGQGVQLEADSSITYDDERGIVRTRGITDLITEDADPVRSETLIYDVRAERGTALRARTTYSDGANWIVDADMDWVSDGLLFGSSARFTSCELEVPHSYFQARELKVMGGQVLVARSVRMYVDDVPVMWLPFIAQNLGSGRASGILTPSFSMNDVVRTSSGYSRRVSNLGYYWAMSDYSDATLAMDWWSGNYTALTGALRYRWAHQFLDGHFTGKHFWRENGSRELSFATRHSWQASERTRAQVNASYVSNTSFVNQNSLDPRELNQTIDSDAGLSRRFDWGSVQLAANRRQYLTDDRTDLTLPSVGVTFNTVTLFDAPAAEASWYNNVTVRGNSTLRRTVNERALQPDTAFFISRATQRRNQGNVAGGIGIGNLNLDGRLELEESVFSDVPAALHPGLESGAGDYTRGQGQWSANVSYQQRLIASTILTPSLSLGADLIRTDSIPEASSFVAGPQRLRFGAGLQTEIYGFFRGIGEFEAIRHKVTPSVSFQYAPEVTPTELQRRVFGDRVARAQRVLTFGFNQTFEAKVREREPETPATPTPDEVRPPSVEGDLPEVEREPGVTPEEVEEERLPPLRPPGAGDREEEDGPTRLPPSRVVTLLGIQTSSMTYDLIQADSTGWWLDGFTTTRLQNTIRSDYLQGLDLSFEHDLFTRPAMGSEERREFRPHLSQLSLGFSLDDRSSVVRLLGRLLGGDEPEEPPTRREPDPSEGEEDPFAAREDPFAGGQAGFDPNRMSMGGPGMDLFGSRARRDGWNARIRYSLLRPRPLDGEGESGGVSLNSQTLQGSFSFNPSEHWSADWNTSYDFEANRFLDHVVTLRRDLHEWEAIFGFRQTATGNWSFHFEVSLKANRELRFDFEQRSLERGGAGAF